jgi:hypothetical protein
MLVFDKNGKEHKLKVVGSYGTFYDPVVLLNGEELVTELHYVTEDDSGKLEIGEKVCQSSGCDYCRCDILGCRLSNNGKRTEYII